MRTTYLKIYLDALRHNLRAIRALVPKHTETVAVVKANSYGYGAVHVAAMAMEEGYEALAVAVTSEAKQLREAGFKCPIYLLGLLMPEEYEDAFNTVPSFRCANRQICSSLMKRRHVLAKPPA